MRPLTGVGLVVVGLVGSLLFGSSDCAPQQLGRNSNYVVGEQSSGRVGKVEINSSSGTTSSTNAVNYQQQAQSSPRLVPLPQAQPTQQVTPPQSNQIQRLQSVPVQQEQQQQQSQYERELALYRQALMAYQQQTVTAQPQIQTRFYEPQQYVQPQQLQLQPYQPQSYQPQPYQPQPYQPQPYQPQPYQTQPYQPQPYQQQAYQPQPYQQQAYQQQPYQPQPFASQPSFQSYSPYSQPNYYSMPLGVSSRPSSSSSLFSGLSDGLRSLTRGLGLFG